MRDAERVRLVTSVEVSDPATEVKIHFSRRRGRVGVDRRAPMAQCRAAHHGELLPVALEQVLFVDFIYGRFIHLFMILHTIQFQRIR